MRIPYIVGNWKMHKTLSEAGAFASEFRKAYDALDTDIRAGICAPYLQLAALKEAFSGSRIELGAQNMHFEDEGAFTGEISAPMLKDIGIELCIIGHSERREYFGETDESVNLKLKKCFALEIRPILCVGESLEIREKGEAEDFVRQQLKKDLEGIASEDVPKLTVAYEPIWAIGTGRTASPEQANEMCGFIRSCIAEKYGSELADEVIIQYGGSVKPENIREIMNMPEIDGALVGGASLEAESFLALINF